MLERKLTALAKKKTHETIPYSFGWRYNDLTAGMLMNMIALFIERPQIFSRSSLQIVIYKRRAVLRKFINLFCFFCFFLFEAFSWRQKNHVGFWKTNVYVPVCQHVEVDWDEKKLGETFEFQIKGNTIKRYGYPDRENPKNHKPHSEHEKWMFYILLDILSEFSSTKY